MRRIIPFMFLTIDNLSVVVGRFYNPIVFPNSVIFSHRFLHIIKMVTSTGLEPVSLDLEGPCTILLCYEAIPS